MTVTFIAALSEDGIIAQNDRIPWHLPDEVAHFRAYCAGKWLMVGRKTWEQMEGWLLPGQTPVVVSRNASLEVPGGYAVTSVEAGLALARVHDALECVVIGGGGVFQAALPYADILMLSVVHTLLEERHAFSGNRSGAMESHRKHAARGRCRSCLCVHHSSVAEGCRLVAYTLRGSPGPCMMAPMNEFHLTPRGDRWELTDNGQPMGSFPSKKRALERSLSIVAEVGGSLAVHRADGTVEEEHKYPGPADSITPAG